jgi:glucosamine-6-phosphate deaminase
MRLIVVEDYEGLSWEAARLIARRLLVKPDLVIALPTGETPKGMYQNLVRLYRESLVDFSQAITFNLDEYLGIPEEHPQSFKSYMHRHLWDHVNLKGAHIPSSLTSDPEGECVRYEELIREACGIDLAVLGIGENGHIGFNEPGTPWESETHVAKLSLETRQAAASHFGGLEEVPKLAITIGIKTIMRARKMLLLASGEEKAKALARALHGPITPAVPASIVQLHPKLTVVADRAAMRYLANNS